MRRILNGISYNDASLIIILELNNYSESDGDDGGGQHSILTFKVQTQSIVLQ